MEIPIYNEEFIYGYLIQIHLCLWLARHLRETIGFDVYTRQFYP